MKYYRELDIDFSEIKEAILEEYCEETMGRFWNPVEQKHLDILQRMFEPLNITPLEYVLINANTRTYQVHTDISIQPFRINIPILNCEYSSTHFFRVKDQKTIEKKINQVRERKSEIGNWPGLGPYEIPKSKNLSRYQKSQERQNIAGADYTKFELTEVELVDQVRLVKPTILRIREPHAVAVTKKDISRLSLTVEFKENLESLLEDGSMPQP
jgi:hypothetical protein